MPYCYLPCLLHLLTDCSWCLLSSCTTDVSKSIRNWLSSFKKDIPEAIFKPPRTLAAPSALQAHLVRLSKMPASITGLMTSRRGTNADTEISTNDAAKIQQSRRQSSRIRDQPPQVFVDDYGKVSATQDGPWFFVTLSVIVPAGVTHCHI